MLIKITILSLSHRQISGVHSESLALHNRLLTAILVTALMRVKIYALALADHNFFRPIVDSTASKELKSSPKTAWIHSGCTFAAQKKCLPVSLRKVSQRDLKEKFKVVSC